MKKQIDNRFDTLKEVYVNQTVHEKDLTRFVEHDVVKNIKAKLQIFAKEDMVIKEIKKLADFQNKLKTDLKTNYTTFDNVKKEIRMVNNNVYEEFLPKHEFKTQVLRYDTRLKELDEITGQCKSSLQNHTRHI